MDTVFSFVIIPNPTSCSYQKTMSPSDFQHAPWPSSTPHGLLSPQSWYSDRVTPSGSFECHPIHAGVERSLRQQPRKAHFPQEQIGSTIKCESLITLCRPQATSLTSTTYVRQCHGDNTPLCVWVPINYEHTGQAEGNSWRKENGNSSYIHNQQSIQWRIYLIMEGRAATWNYFIFYY